MVLNLPLPVEYLLVLLTAVAVDLFFGEPPAPLHPVVWMGKWINLLDRVAPRQNRNLQLLYGLVTVLVSTGLLFWLSGLLFNWLRGVSPLATLLLEAFGLKSCFSVRMLSDTGLKIRRALAQGKLEEARAEMRSLVSRDVSRLDEQLIIAATIESVAENTTDSFVAPLFFFALFGVPGALAYRLVNTFDSMIGYHGKYEFLGKAAAILDDILNYLPARLSALLLVLSASWYNGDRRNAWKIARRDHARTASPNAGWTMAAIAGALHAQLEKVGHYKLGDSERVLVPRQINQAVAALYIVALECVVLYTAGAIAIAFIMLSR